MYKIRRRHIDGSFVETLAVTADPCRAYEKAHELDAQNMGEPFIIEIVDDNGNDMWSYCARRRCASGVANEYQTFTSGPNAHLYIAEENESGD
jgi:hypothetical protein